MAFKKKTTADTKWLNNPVGSAQATQKGNAGVNLSSPDICYDSGLSRVNSKGQVTDKQGKILNWPFQKFTVDNELNPRSNQTNTEILSENPQAYGDFTADGKVGGLSSVRQTIG